MSEKRGTSDIILGITGHVGVPVEVYGRVADTLKSVLESLDSNKSDHNYQVEIWSFFGCGADAGSGLETSDKGLQFLTQGLENRDRVTNEFVTKKFAFDEQRPKDGIQEKRAYIIYPLSKEIYDAFKLIYGDSFFMIGVTVDPEIQKRELSNRVRRQFSLDSTESEDGYDVRRVDYPETVADEIIARTMNQYKAKAGTIGNTSDQFVQVFEEHYARSSEVFVESDLFIDGSSFTEERDEIEKVETRHGIKGDKVGGDRKEDAEEREAAKNEEAGKLVKTLQRFIHLIFKNPFITPTKDEHAMFLAYTAAIRSADLNRTVGAAIVNDDYDVIAMGCNDVPKAGGGTVWDDDFDLQEARDHKRGYDFNHSLMTKMFVNGARNLVRRLESNLSPRENQNETPLDEALKLLSGGPDRERFSITRSDFEALEKFASEDDKKEYSDDIEKIIKNLKENLFQKILDVPPITEFARSVHAEMDAITTAARNGLAIKGARLYTTTFPCHNCARHIIASGISEVNYIEPYEKSMAFCLHDDAIQFGNIPYIKQDEEEVGVNLQNENPKESRAGRDGSEKKGAPARKKVKFAIYQGINPALHVKMFPRNRDRKDGKGLARTDWERVVTFTRSPDEISKGETAFLAQIKNKTQLATESVPAIVTGQGAVGPVEKNDPPTCNACGATMLKRVNNTTQQRFWGCPNFADRSKGKHDTFTIK